MNVKNFYVIAVFTIVLLCPGCRSNHDAAKPPRDTLQNQSAGQPEQLEAAGTAAGLLSPGERQYKTELIRKYAKTAPRLWGENIPGVWKRMVTIDKAIALTFDACGGTGGTGYDRELIDYLIEQNIPATLFINARWIDANPDTFMLLASNRLFEIENHGYLHRPLSVNGMSAWGIQGTRNVGEVVDEVLVGTNKIHKLTGRRPIYFRSGTAYYDDVSVRIIRDLGLRAVNYTVLGDAGATYSASQIKSALLSASSGSIVICQMNHPEKATAEGIKQSIPELKRRGFRFVKLATYPLH